MPGVFACPAGAKGFSNITWLCQVMFGPAHGTLLVAVGPYLGKGGESRGRDITFPLGSSARHHGFGGLRNAARERAQSGSVRG